MRARNVAAAYRQEHPSPTESRQATSELRRRGTKNGTARRTKLLSFRNNIGEHDAFSNLHSCFRCSLEICGSASCEMMNSDMRDGRKNAARYQVKPGRCTYGHGLPSSAYTYLSRKACLRSTTGQLGLQYRQPAGLSVMCTLFSVGSLVLRKSDVFTNLIFDLPSPCATSLHSIRTV